VVEKVLVEEWSIEPNRTGKKFLKRLLRNFDLAAKVCRGVSAGMLRIVLCGDGKLYCTEPESNSWVAGLLFVGSGWRNFPRTDNTPNLEDALLRLFKKWWLSRTRTDIVEKFTT
jgi:hypothetical protein